VSTRIVFDGGSELVVAQEQADVVHAVRRDHPNPVTLESSTGRPLHINWDHVAFMDETLAEPTSGD
jgi:heptaprenylglyceryl phosphate synthase